MKTNREAGNCWSSLLEGEYCANAWIQDQMQKKLTLERFQREVSREFEQEFDNVLCITLFFGFRKVFIMAGLFLFPVIICIFGLLHLKCFVEIFFGRRWVPMEFNDFHFSFSRILGLTSVGQTSPGIMQEEVQTYPIYKSDRGFGVKPVLRWPSLFNER